MRLLTTSHQPYWLIKLLFTKNSLHKCGEKRQSNAHKNGPSHKGLELKRSRSVEDSISEYSEGGGPVYSEVVNDVLYNGNLDIPRVIFRNPTKEKFANGIKNTKEIEDEGDVDGVGSGFVLKGFVEIDSDDENGEGVGDPEG